MPSDTRHAWRRQSFRREAANQRQSNGLHALPYLLALCDLVVVLLSVVTATLVVGPPSTWWAGSSAEAVPGLALGMPTLTIGWLLLIALFGGYERRVLGASATEFSRVLRASIACGAAVGVGSYLMRSELSRDWFVAVFGVGIPMLLVVRAAARARLKQVRARGGLQHRVLLVGDVAHTDSVATVLAREEWLGYDVVGALAPEQEGSETAAGIPVVGGLTDVAESAREVNADVVLLTGGAVTSPDEQRDIAYELEHDRAQLVVAPSVNDISSERVQVRPVGGLPLLHLEKPRAAKAASWAKRTFDVLGAGAILVLASPLLLATALRIWVHDRGPVLFKQQRIGRFGEPFRCWKFRTMAVDAEERLAAVLEAEGLEHGAFAKLERDPRITEPGRWMRRLSVDELPQLVNVIRGDMSLVGPRPQTQEEVSGYEGVEARRLQVRPGMTGLWQVSGRSDLSVDESMRLDRYYVDNWSMMQDLAIMFRTVGAVFGSRGAY
ncbi:sugar transferase [Nocardioides marmoraquaticus]